MYGNEQEFMGDFKIKGCPLPQILIMVIENIISMTWIKTTFAAPCIERYYKTLGQSHAWLKTLSAYCKTKN